MLLGVSLYLSKDVSYLSLFVVKVIRVNSKLIKYLLLLILKYNLHVIRQLLWVRECFGTRLFMTTSQGSGRFRSRWRLRQDTLGVRTSSI